MKYRVIFPKYRVLAARSWWPAIQSICIPSLPKTELRERIHLLLIDEAGKGLDDVAAGRVTSARGTIRSIKRHRSR